MNLKKEFLKLLREDEEFKYAVAGFIGMNEILKKLDKHERIIIELREDFNTLRRDFNRMLEEIKIINLRLNRVEKTLEKLTLDIEEEARSILSYRLKNEGINIQVEPLTLKETEINLYGASNNICVIGEATVRAGSNLLDELEEKIKILQRKHPHLLKGKTILVIYTSLATPDLIKKAKEKKVWVLKATGDIFKPEKLMKKQLLQRKERNKENTNSKCIGKN